MTKPIHQRGFEVRGKFPPYDDIRYRINNKGLEDVSITPKMLVSFSNVRLTLNDGTLKRLTIFTNQFFFDSNDDSNDLSSKTRQIIYEEGKRLYDEIYKLLEVEKRLEDYIPRFSSESEITLTNVLGIEDVSEISKLKGWITFPPPN